LAQQLALYRDSGSINHISLSSRYSIRLIIINLCGDVTFLLPQYHFCFC